MNVGDATFDLIASTGRECRMAPAIAEVKRTEAIIEVKSEIEW